ncbi:MAG: hypothetical protein WDW36_002631 [Sanguina aurantia]
MQRGITQLRAVSVTDKISFKSAENQTPVTFAPIINGCWTLAGGHGREVFNGIDGKLRAHATAGFTSFDTADIYGSSEQILGQFAKTWADEGNTPVQIFTKYVPNIFNQRPTPSSVEAAIRKSMANLQVAQLDLVQLHWWDYGIEGLVDTTKALADCQAKGLIKAVGATNMNTEALAMMVDSGVNVVNNQVQFSLLDRRPLNGMLQYCEENGIRLFTYGTVAGGLLSDKYVEEPKSGLFGGPKKYSKPELTTSSQKMYMGTIQKFGGPDLWRELVKTLKGVADKHSASVANVAVQWAMQQGNGTMVHPIVGMRNISHIADNTRGLGLHLDSADLASIQSVLDRSSGPNGDCYSFEREN